MNAIETRYAGHLFRSRLEARWAAFFDLLHWRWVYEPVDLGGYIPDFIVHFRKPLLVEIKPVSATGEALAYTSAINRAAWPHEALILGVDWCLGDDGVRAPFLGLLRDSECGWGAARWFHCVRCRRPSFYHDAGSYRCRASNCYRGARHMDAIDNDDMARRWGRAHELTRWRGRHG